MGVTRRPFFATIAIAALLLIPLVASAAGEKANTACNGCQDDDPKKPKYCAYITCTDITGTAKTVGKCVEEGICRAVSTGVQGGSTMKLGDLGKLLEAVGGIMKALGGGQPAGGSGGATGGTGTTPQGCTQYYQVSSPSSDPCAYYVPQTSDSLNGGTGTGGTGGTNSASDLINALGGSGGTGGTNTGTVLDDIGEPAGPVSGLIDSSNSNDNTNDSTTGSSAVVISTSTSGSVVVQGSGGQPSLTGDIVLLGKGVTAVILNPNAEGNSVVAGFYGTDSFGSAPQSVAAQWCRSRPWAKNFLSTIIPPTFFDNLCTLRGFPVGEPAVTVQTGRPTVVLTQNPSPRATTTSVATSTMPAVLPMQADIWAVPAAVRLGTRTTIFWNSKNAATCKESASDGNFSQNSLTGGAATVPLSGPTTFTIVCTDPAGGTIENSVRVNLAI